MCDKSRKKIMNLACRAGKIVLENGGEIYRVEQTMASVCASYGITDCECFATPTAIILSTPHTDGDIYSRMIRITARGINLNKIAAINDFSRKLPIDVSEALDELKRIEDDAPHPLWVTLPAASIGASAFTIILGGRWNDVIGALVLGALIRLVVTALHKKDAGDFMVNLFGGAAAAFGGWLVYQLGIVSDQWIITVSALMLLFPGLLFTNAMRDIASGDLVSGCSRGAEVISVATALACGTAAVYAVLSLMGGGVP